MKQAKQNPKELQEGIHFYIEDGKYVFTALFLSNRGTCCGNLCRHCPYAHINVADKKPNSTFNA